MKKIFISILLFFATAISQTPSVFNLQGILRSPTGQAVSDGQYSFAFKIYDQATGGTALGGWAETQKIDVKNGIYNALVGSVTAFTGLAFDKTYFVGIAIAGGDELSPRIQLTATPYALSLQGVGNKVPNDGAMSFSSDVLHKSNNIGRLKFNAGGTNEIHGGTSIYGNSNILRLVGTDHTFIEFYPDGIAAGRKGYFGYPGATVNDIYITNEINNANIILNPTGTGKVATSTNLDVGGSLNVVNAEGSNVMVKVAGFTSNDFNTGNISITGLDGNKHKKYKVYYELYRDGGGSNDDYLYIRFNGDAGNNYRHEGYVKYMGADGRHPYNWDGSAFMTLHNGWKHNGWFIGEFTIFAETGKLRNAYGSTNFISSNPAYGIWSGYWSNQNDNITSIQFAANRTFHRGTISIYAIP